LIGSRNSIPAGQRRKKTAAGAGETPRTLPLTLPPPFSIIHWRVKLSLRAEKLKLKLIL
jgi:hypothetical protein